MGREVLMRREEKRREETRPDQTRPDQTRQDRQTKTRQDKTDKTRQDARRGERNDGVDESAIESISASRMILNPKIILWDTLNPLTSSSSSALLVQGMFAQHRVMKEVLLSAHLSCCSRLILLQIEVFLFSYGPNDGSL
eukprot:749198-Hanusia_phi.AAC.2